MTVTVTVNQMVMRADTAQVSYTISNGSQSQDSLFMFIVDAPARVKTILRPQPDSDWMVDSLVHSNEPAAFWLDLSLVAPSAVTPTLTFESVGLPGVVTNWSIGHWPPKNCCDDDPAGSGEDVFVTRAIQSSTAGVQPWPTDRSTQALIARLRTLSQNVCASPLNWITNSTLCSQLVSDLDTAESFRAAGATSQLQSTMDHYKGLLGTSTAFATGVNSAAFWTLSVNADIIRNSV